MKQKKSDPAAILSRRLVAAEHEIAALMKQLDHTQRLATIGGLCAMVAHEFNNILTPLLPYAQLAAASPGDRALAGEFAQRTVDAVQRAAGITEAILGFSAPEESGSAVSNVSACIETSLQFLPRETNQAGSKFCVDAESDLQVQITPVVLQQVLLNLMLNSCEAIDPARGRILIAARCSTWNGSPGVAITVQDNGRGIDAPDIKRLFEPFYTNRAQHSTPGHGLGLPMCKRLIEAAGGVIEIESTPGVGTAVNIWLPRAATTQSKTRRQPYKDLALPAAA